MSAQAFAVLIRREFWEHRMLWMAPLVVGALYLLLCLVPGAVNPENIHVGRPAAGDVSLMLALQAFVFGAAVALAAILLFFYLIDCLYAERRDRSILFWKSLPVSDSATVLSKVVVALFIVPLGVFALALVVNLLGFGILYARLHGGPLGPFVSLDFAAWARMTGVIAVDIVIISLWYAPLAGYQLLVSAWAKSSPFVWTILPPLVVVFAERLVFGTWNTLAMIASRLFFGMLGIAQQRRIPQSELFNRIDGAGLLQDPEFYIGLGVAALLVFAAIRIRRYRDDT